MPPAPLYYYRIKENQSLKSYTLLAYVSHVTTKYLQHARHREEQRVRNYKLDGFCEDNSRKFGLEFHGCFWHGCPKCYSRDTVNHVNVAKRCQSFKCKRAFWVELV